MNKTKLTLEQVFLANGYIKIAEGTCSETDVKANRQLFGTFLSNLAYYGYVPSKQIVDFLANRPVQDTINLWRKLEPALKANSGEGRKIGDHVVYKNFPTEVLDMSRAEYWFNQILMYIGYPNEWFTTPEEPRAALFENVTMKVLHVADGNTLADIFNNLLKLPARWTDTQEEHAKFLLDSYGKNVRVAIDLDSVGFKENGIKAVIHAISTGLNADVNITTGTDVLRLAAGMSDADVSLRTEFKFRKFKRAERRFLVTLLESAKNLEDDFAARPAQWKKLMMILHPGDFKSATRVNAAYDKLYKGEVRSFASKVDPSNIRKSDLKLLASRPGEFLRRFHSVYGLFGKDAITAFGDIVGKLSTSQLVKFNKYLLTINSRKQLVYAPRGNWNRLQIVPNEKMKLEIADIRKLSAVIDAEISERLSKIIPEGVLLDDSVDLIKLQTNDQKLASYGRGTQFPIPDNIKFIRSASYWGDKKSAARGSNTWMDNGWNFYDENWNGMGSLCWNSTVFGKNAAVFSGDPTNSKTVDGKACQMIDLYLDKLAAMGVRYAVWNILSFNNVPFDTVDDIFASLQWGEDATAGKLYEPSRAQMEFQVTGQNKTKFIAYIDLVERKLVYMDANLKGAVNSATSNLQSLGEKMPAFIEYLNSLPSVYDLFQSAKKGTVPVLFTDTDTKIETETAYVFRTENPENSFKKLDLTAILS